MSILRLATRQSPLALVQTEMVAARLRHVLRTETELVKIVTTGDRQSEWSLEAKGGKGLFTSELEQAVLRGDAELAVHSTKDLPGDMPAGLTIAGYLPRADPRDVLVLRAGIQRPLKIATGSPRRRLQVARLHPGVEFSEIRGNVDTRLRKIADGIADGTVLAAAGLKRLGLAGWPGLEFRPFSLEEMVPAVGQGAIAVQSRIESAQKFSDAFDDGTARAVSLERALQNALGGGCHTAFGAHVAAHMLYFFHEQTGVRVMPLSAADLDTPAECAARMLRHLSLR